MDQSAPIKFNFEWEHSKSCPNVWNQTIHWEALNNVIEIKKSRSLGSMSQSVYKLILWKIFLPWFWFQWSNQLTILHMSRQLSCRDMCKIVTWFDHHFPSKSNMNFNEIWVMSLWALCTMGPWSLGHSTRIPIWAGCVKVGQKRSGFGSLPAACTAVGQGQGPLYWEFKSCATQCYHWNKKLENFFCHKYH